MNEPTNFICQPDLTKREVQELVLQASEPVFCIEATEIVVKILNSTYEKSYLDKVAEAAVHLDKD